MADAYAEALERNPRQLDVRILLGQTSLKLGETDEALRQAKLVLDADKDQPDALCSRPGRWPSSPGPTARWRPAGPRRSQLLAAAVKKQPTFADAYHLIAEIEMLGRHRDKAIATLKAGLKAVPDDATGLATLIELLTEPREDGRKPTPAELAEAQALAESVGQRDDEGEPDAGPGRRLPQGRPARARHALGREGRGQARRTAGPPQLRRPPALGRRGGPATRSRPGATSSGPSPSTTWSSRRQANSVEAINNKAWILHTYLGESRGP